MKFIHAADLHLDSPLRGLERYPGAPVDLLRGATRRALENLVELACAETVDLVLLAGDLYDGDWKDYNTGLFFNHQMARLREAGIEVVLLAGNHDAASEISRVLRSVESMPNVHRLSEQRPETRQFESLGVAVHGQGFARRAVTQNLASKYPQALPGLFNIGLLHTSLTGRPGHAPYAPCSLDDLRCKGYDYWALGHVHQQEIVSRDPWVVFPGNPQGRHIGETGAKGCMLVSVEDGRVRVEARPLDVLRWRRCRVDVTGAEDEDVALERVMASLVESGDWEGPEAVRLELVGACRAHAALSRQSDRWINELRGHGTDVSNGRLWIEKIELRTQGEVPLAQLEQGEDVTALLLREIRSLTSETPLLQWLAAERDALKARLPADLRDDAWLAVEHPETFNALQEDVIRLLLSRLGSQAVDPTRS